MWDGAVRDFAHWTPRAPAVVLPDRVVSYAEFNADIDRCGRALLELDLTPDGTNVAVDLDEPYLRHLVTVALARVGITSSPASDHAADLVLSDGSQPDNPRCVSLSSAWKASMLAAEPAPLPIRVEPPDGFGRIMLSSGTTGAPKRVGLSWRRLEYGCHANLRSFAAGKHGVWVPLVGIDAMLGFTMTIGAWSVGAAVGLGARAEELGPWLEDLPSGLVGMTPDHLRMTLDNLPRGFQPRPTWRLAVAGAVLSWPLAREAILRLTPDVGVVYGSTESSLHGVGPAQRIETQPGYVGRTPAGAILEVVDEAGAPVEDGHSGEFRVRSERMSAGYINDPEATAARFRDGWFYTRDVGRRTVDGGLVLEGRVDDRMNFNGAKIMPAVLEVVAQAVTGVRDCAAFQAPDARGSEIGWLAVVAAADAPIDVRATLAAAFKARSDLPQIGFAWIDEIPRNGMGKVDRGRLRELLMAATSGRTEA